MDSDKLNRWVSLGANIGVFIGLIFLVVELKQTNDLAEASAYRARGDEIQSALQSVALSADVAEILVKVDAEGVDALSAVEARGKLAEAARRHHLWIELDIPLNDPEFNRVVEAAVLEAQK
jgi:hypothetical protein